MAKTSKEGNWFDKLAQGFAEGMADIRQKVVEEGWWGRTLEDGSTLKINTEPKPEKAIPVEAELMPYNVQRPESFEEYRAMVDRKETPRLEQSKQQDEELEQ